MRWNPGVNRILDEYQVWINIKIKELGSYYWFHRVPKNMRPLSLNELREEINFLTIYYFEIYNFPKNFGTERKKIKQKSPIIPFHRRCVCSRLSLSDTVAVCPFGANFERKYWTITTFRPYPEPKTKPNNSQAKP